MSVSSQPHRQWLLAWALPVAGLALALLPMPYGYYVLLRIVVCGCAAFLAYQSHQLRLEGWAWALGAVAFLYNPVAPFGLGRTVWTAVNLGTIVLLALHWRAVARQSTSEQ